MVIENWVELSEYWDAIYCMALARHTQKRKFRSSNLWTAKENTHFYGLCGEVVVALETGLKVDRSLRINGDPGYDFVVNGCTFDVKTSTFWHSPDLKEFTNKELVADEYILVALDMERRRGRVVGWVTREQLVSAHTIDYGYGPRLSISQDRFVELGQTGLPASIFGENKAGAMSLWEGTL